MILGVLIGLMEVVGDSTSLNILHLTDEKNDVSDLMLKTSLATFTNNTLRKVSGLNDDYKQYQFDLCSTYADMLDSGHPPDLVYDTTFTGLISDSSNKFTASLGLPTFTTSYGLDGDMTDWSNLNDAQRKYLIQINPPNELIPEIVRPIVYEQAYSTAAVLVDENYEISHKYKSLLQNLAVRHTIANINMSHTIQQLLEIKRNDLFNIFVIGSLNNIKLVLTSADAISQFTETHSWHAITHEQGVLQCPCKRAKVFFAQTRASENTRLTTPYLFSKFYLDLFELLYNATLNAYDRINHKNFTYIKCEEYNGTNTPDRNGLDLKGNFMELTQNEKFSLVEQRAFKMNFDLALSFIEFREGSLYNVEPLGTWSANFDGSLNLTNRRLFHKYASKTIFRVITRIYHPFIYKDEHSPRGFTGYCIDLLDEIAQSLGFDYKVLEVVDGEMGNLDDDGNWNGLIQELVEKRADIALSALSVTAEREEAVDFTVPYYDMIGHSILLRVHETSNSLFRFLQVFDDDVWYTIIGIYLATSIFIWILYKLSPYGYKYTKTKKEVRDFNFWECLWFCLVSITPAGGGEAPINSSGRTMVAFWWFFCYITYSSYSANLAAFLTVSRLESTINNLDDLVKQYDIRYTTINGSGSQDYFKRMAHIENKLLMKWQEMNMADGISHYERSKYAVWDYPLSDKFTKIWNNMEAVGFPNTIEDSVKLVRSSPSPGKGYAIILDGIDAQYLSITNCDLEWVDEFFKRPLAIAVQRGSYLKDRLSAAILELSNRRVLANLKKKWWTLNPHRKECISEMDSTSVDIANIGGVFIYLFCALSVIIVISIIEHIYKKIKLNKIKNSRVP